MLLPCLNQKKCRSMMWYTQNPTDPWAQFDRSTLTSPPHHVEGVTCVCDTNKPPTNPVLIMHTSKNEHLLPTMQQTKRCLDWPTLNFITMLIIVAYRERKRLSKEKNELVWYGTTIVRYCSLHQVNLSAPVTGMRNDASRKRDNRFAPWLMDWWMDFHLIKW